MPISELSLSCRLEAVRRTDSTAFEALRPDPPNELIYRTTLPYCVTADKGDTSSPFPTQSRPTVSRISAFLSSATFAPWT